MSWDQTMCSLQQQALKSNSSGQNCFVCGGGLQDTPEQQLEGQHHTISTGLFMWQPMASGRNIVLGSARQYMSLRAFEKRLFYIKESKEL